MSGLKPPGAGRPEQKPSLSGNRMVRAPGAGQPKPSLSGNRVVGASPSVTTRSGALVGQQGALSKSTRASIDELQKLARRLPGCPPTSLTTSTPKAEVVRLLKDISRMPELQPHLTDPQYYASLTQSSPDAEIASVVGELHAAAQTAEADLRRARSAVAELVESTRIALPHARTSSAGTVSSADADGLRRIAGFVYDEVSRVSASVVAGCTRLDDSAQLDKIADAAARLDAAVRTASRPSELTFVLPPGSVSVPSRMTATDLSARRSHGFVVGDNARTTLIHRCHVVRPVVEIADLIRASAAGAETSRGARGAEDEHGVVVRHRIFVATDAALAFQESSVTRGDGARSQHDVRGTITGCAVGAEKLLAHPEVLEKVLVLADAPEGLQREAAQADLIARIRDIAAADAPVEWIDGIEDLVSESYPGTVSGRFGSIQIAHLVGGAVGVENTLKVTEVYSATRPIVR